MFFLSFSSPRAIKKQLLWGLDLALISADAAAAVEHLGLDSKVMGLDFAAAAAAVAAAAHLRLERPPDLKKTIVAPLAKGH